MTSSAATCVFQSFEEKTDPSTVAPRVAALRAELQRQGLAGCVIPRSDKHQGEYVPACDERLAWATGFTGSAGSAIVLADKAALVVDGRYTLQSVAQTDTSVITPVQLAEMSLEGWIEAHLPAGGVLGFDPWVHTPDQAAKLASAAEKAGGSVRALDDNPIDSLWQDRPAPPHGKVSLYPEMLAGEAAAQKLARVQAALAKAKLDALVISDPHNLCWLLNLRGADVPHTPLMLGFGIVPATGPMLAFVGAGKITADIASALAGVALFADETDFVAALRDLGAAQARVRLEAASAPEAVRLILVESGAKPDVGADPIALMKARKNAVEIAGSRAAHRRDGAAVARFLSWFSHEAPSGTLTEIDAVAALERCRRDTNALRDVSFPTISGAGPNAALPHYRVSAVSNRVIAPGIFLIDSGGQYEDGTTDITRTLAVGEVSAEMKERYTLVLKGHVAISRAVFPKGTSGAQIDALARQPLWEAGLDFDHGTGHGVGAFLSVHEGPQRIAKVGHTPLEPGMILSNEPGYYKEGAYGIRIENLIVVEERAIPGGERPMLGFETVTLSPYDRALIARELLTAAETAWIDAYHARVLAEIGPLVDEPTRAWLEGACAPL